MRLLKPTVYCELLGRGRQVRTLINKGYFLVAEDEEKTYHSFNAFSPRSWYSKETMSKLKSFSCSEKGASIPGIKTMKISCWSFLYP